MKEIIATKSAPAAIGPYSQGISAGNLVITSGQLPVDPATGSFAPGGVAEQTHLSLTLSLIHISLQSAARLRSLSALPGLRNTAKWSQSTLWHAIVPRKFGRES